MRKSKVTQQEQIEIKTNLLSSAEISDYKDLKILTGYKEYKGKVLPVMSVWKGRASKPMSNYFYVSVDKLGEHMLSLMKAADEREAKKNLAKEKKEKAKAIGHDFHVGQIFYDSWGYEQTNIDFYEVVRTTGKTVWLKEIAAEKKYTGDMVGTTTAIPKKYISEEMKKSVLWGDWNTKNNGFYLKSSYGGMSPWNGEPKRFSSYA